MPEERQLTEAFTSYAQARLGDCLAQIERCVRLLDPGQLWHRPNDVSNSVGVLVLHLTGNVGQWIVAGVGGAPFHRDRPAEFAQRDPLPAESILSALRQTIEQACAVTTGLTPEALLKMYAIQDRQVTGLAAVFHVVEHFSLHTGQIVYATKLFINRDLGLYDAHGRRIDQRESAAP